jgi:hypothetical protein
VLRDEAPARPLVIEPDELSTGPPDGLTELVGPADALTLPERHQARDAGRGRDEHPVAGDLLDPPGRRSQQECLSGPGLVDHLLVQLADAPTAVDEVDPEEPSVGDRARVRDGEPARPLATSEQPRDPVPGDPRAKLGELLGRIAPGEHVEDVLQLLPGEVAERPGAPDEVVQLVDGDLLLRADRDDLLREDVERVSRHPRLLDRSLLHPPDDDRGLEQVGPKLGEDAALRRLVETVSRPADPLESPGDRLR